MTARDQQRTRVLTRILMGELTMADGSVELRLSVRQLWRLRAAFVERGPVGLVTPGRYAPAVVAADSADRRRGSTGDTPNPSGP